MELPSGWMQGRSVFGGLTAAASVALAHRVIAPERVFRSVQMQLLRPTVAGEVRGEVRVLREGKYTSFVSVTLHQERGPTLIANLVFAARREGTTPVTAAPVWEGPAVDGLPNLPFIPNITPEFVQQVDLRWADGGVPFSGAAEASFRTYCRFLEPSGGPEGVIGLMDVFPAPSLAVLTNPAPASTVTWSAHVLDAPDTLDGFCKFEYETIAGKDGMHTVAGRLHDANGKLLGWTEQLAAVFG